MITDAEYLDILQGLEDHHAIFYQLWEMGRPVFTEEVDTSAVRFDLKNQYLAFQFNPDFWEELDDYSRLFVIAHEALHVLLNHGARCASPQDDADLRDMNVAMDVTVNTQLVGAFGFRRECLDDRIAQAGCFKDTVFGPDREVRFNHFEYLYRQLAAVETAGLEVWGFDDHAGLDDIPDELVERVCDRAGRRMSDREIEEVNEALDDSSAGDYTPLASRVMPDERVEPNDKWAEVINRWVRRNEPVDEIEERWDRAPRRLQNASSGLSVPREHLVGRLDKPSVVFFVDTSGSCRRFARRFMRCVDSIPHHHFDVDLYCFDTRVYPIEPGKRRLRGFGGTSFYPLEYVLTQKVRLGEEYPRAVFVLTDGWGSPVDPAYSARWHWFLTEDSTDKYVPAESHRYHLAEFEG